MSDDGQITLLLVEDSAWTAQLVLDQLAFMRRPRVQTHHATNIRDAVEALREGSFDIVLLDLGLPDATGLEALTAVREIAPDVPVVVRTGLNDDHVALRALTAGAQDYVIKGARNSEEILVRSIRYALARRGAERERDLALRELAEAQQIARVGSWTWNPETAAATWSPEMYCIFGRDPHEQPATGEAFLAYVHHEDREPLAAGFTHTFGAGPAFELDYRIIAGDGAQRTLHMLGRVDPQRIGCFIGTVQDVTELRETERELREQSELLARIVDDAPIGMALLSPDGRFLRVNDALCQIVGYSAQELAGLKFQQITHPEDLEANLTLMQRAVAGEIRTYQIEKRYFHKDAGVIWVKLSVSLVRDGTGAPLHFVSQVEDITEQKRSADALAEAEERFRRAFEDAPIGMALLSLDGRIEQSNAALSVLCGQMRSDLHGLRLCELVHPADVEQTEDLVRVLGGGKAERPTLELRFMPPPGTPVTVSVDATQMVDASGRPAHILCQFVDVTDRKRFEAQLQYMADHDPLTGLVNRRKFESELERHVAHVKRYGAEGALLVLDIDHFKQTNDTLGHNAGDELIISVAQVVRERLRESDLFARLGGDEFAVLLPKADKAEAGHVAEALVDAVRTSVTRLSGEAKKITTSIGVTMFNDAREEMTGESVLIEADLAMFDAKDAGRNRYSFYAQSGHKTSRTEARLTWIGRIERALETDGFALAAQPIFDIRTGAVCQQELLLRLRDDDGDLIPPTVFLYIAERFGVMARVDEWVAERAIELIEQQPDVHLSLNISGHSLGDERLQAALEGHLRASTIEPSHLTFEVTETAAVANIADARVFAQRLRDLGCKLALDDFGAGFGSFYYLKHLPFDFVKIDGEFVQHVASGRIDQLIVDAVVRIARGLGKRTIAEFVNSESALRMVRRLGVDCAQGYYIGQPVLVTDLPLAGPTAPRVQGEGAARGAISAEPAG